VLETLTLTLALGLPFLLINRPLRRLLYYTDRTNSPLNIDEILVPLLYRQNYLAAEHRGDFGCFITQTELPRRRTSARFWLLYYTDRTTSPLNIGEILVDLLYRQNYLALIIGEIFVRYIREIKLSHIPTFT